MQYCSVVDQTTAVDIVILSNGPGEVATWVRPVVAALRSQLGNDPDRLRISLILSPCPNASGQEVAIARTLAGLDRIQAAAHFFPFLLQGKTIDQWDWRDRGVVLFLGGDQLYPVVIGKRLGYSIVIYGEWETRWHRWVDQFGVMNGAIRDRAPVQYRNKFTVVGDLMAEVGKWGDGERQAEDEWVGLLPGSKPAKLAQGLPLALAIAQQIHQVRPQTRFLIPVAPTLDITSLVRFVDPQFNPMATYFGECRAVVNYDGDRPYLVTATGLSVELWIPFPAYERLRQCCLCLTTVGANTAELGAMAIPMLVLLPTQQLDAMRAWDGLPGLLANLPGVGSLIAKVINGWFLRQGRLLAWPNIWAGEAIVPELVGALDPQQVAAIALDLLAHPEKLEQMRDRLRQVRGTPGAADKLTYLICQLIQSSDTKLNFPPPSPAK